MRNLADQKNCNAERIGYRALHIFWGLGLVFKGVGYVVM